MISVQRAGARGWVDAGCPAGGADRRSETASKSMAAADANGGGVDLLREILLGNTEIRLDAGGAPFRFGFQRMQRQVANQETPGETKDQ